MKAEKNSIIEEELLEKVTEAAKIGAIQGVQAYAPRNNTFLSIAGILFQFIIPCILIVFLIFRISSMQASLGDLFSREESIENHDLTLENNGILGYTVADFQDAILGDSHQLKKLEVYITEVSDLASITDTGLGNLKIFSKSQYITYHGTATYTVDLSKLNREDIFLDENTQTVKLYIPHAELEPINIPSETIEYGDITRGVLALGKMNISPEQTSQVETAAKEKMIERLKETDVLDEADRFAKLSVWEMYQPVVVGVASGYSLSVEFVD